jgi:hypothetical protein
MCDPLTIAGGAMAVGSAAANSAAAGRVSRARAAVLAAERARQAAYDQEAQAINTRSQDRYTTFGDQQTQRSQSLGDYFSNARETDSTGVVPQSNSAITVREDADRSAEASEATAKQAASLGNLRAFGDVLGGAGRLAVGAGLSGGSLGGLFGGATRAATGSGTGSLSSFLFNPYSGIGSR